MLIYLNLKFSATRLNAQHFASLRAVHSGYREKYPASTLRCYNFFCKSMRFWKFLLINLLQVNIS